MLIYFEGVDRAGKTTLAKHLAQRIGVPYFKSADTMMKPYDSVLALKYSEMFLLDMLQQIKTDLVKDRGWLSELVYSSVFGRITNKTMINALDVLCSRMDVVIVICEKEELDFVEDVDVPINFYKSIIDEYRNRAAMLFTNVIFINMSEFKLEDGTFDIEAQASYVIEKMKGLTK